MTRVISVANQKGGVGKTTTVLNLGAALHKKSKRTLLVDLDPQAALSTSLGVPISNIPITVYQAMLSQVPVARAIRRTTAGADLIPANIDLSAAEIEMIAEIGRERILAETLRPIRDNYDFILIDCPPSLGLLTINALVAAGEVLIPLQCEYLAMRGMSLLLKTIDKVRAKLNPGIDLAGILLTMYNARTLHSHEVMSEVRSTFGDKVFKTVVRASVRFKEAPAAGLSILDYAGFHEGASAYRDLAEELLNE